MLNDGASFVEAKPLVNLDANPLSDTPGAVTAISLDHLGLDGVVLDGVLSQEECSALLASAERAGFTFWHPAGDASDKRRLRNADTIEFMGAHELCARLWERLRPHVPAECAVRPEQPRWSRDLEGTWAARGLNPHLLINRYAAGGHFAPHADGSTEVSFDERSLYTVLLYLNDCEAGGATQLLRDEQGAATCGGGGGEAPLVARADSVLYSVRPVAGRAVMYWHETMHAGEPVGAGACKYCLRSDVMYARDPPLCTTPADFEAYELYSRARALEGAGQTMDALALFRRCAKLSSTVGRALGVV
jgi:hypothetical protein